MNLLDYITLDDLTENQREIAEAIGLESYRNLVKYYGGTYLYVAQEKGLIENVRNKKIVEEFNGSNIKELARRWNLCEASIRDIVSEKRKQLISSPMDGQEKLF